MARDERDGGGVVAVRERDPRVGRSGDTGGDSRHDLELDSGLRERLGLPSAAPEDERVTALQTDDAAPAARALDHQALDLRLRHLRLTGPLAHIDELGLL